VRLYNPFKLVFAGVFLGLLGCAATIDGPIGYSLSDIKESTNEQLKEINLDIRPFEDIRKSVPENTILFSNSPTDFYLEIEGENYCINREDEYSRASKGEVPLLVSTAISKHLNKRGAFKTVTVNNKENQPVAKSQEKIPEDFYLTGKLKKLYGHQKHQTFGALGLLGVLGGAIAAARETPIKVEIEFTNLAIYKNDGQLLVDIGNVHEVFEEEAKGGMNCKSTYYHVNLKLKSVINSLAEEIEKKMAVSITR